MPTQSCEPKKTHITSCMRFVLWYCRKVPCYVKDEKYNIRISSTQKPSVIIFRSKYSNSIHLVLFLLLADCRIMYIHKSVSEFLPRHWDFLGFLVPSSERLIFMMNLDKSWNFTMFYKIMDSVTVFFFSIETAQYLADSSPLNYTYLKLVVVLH